MSSPAPLGLPAPPPVQPDWALFLDVDGCLLDFADRPEDVTIPDGLCDRLARLAARLDGAIALVSGRRIAQLDELFAPLRIPAAGLHGLELREAAGAPPVPVAPPDALRQVRDAGEQIAARYPGARIEDKGIALALHWRAAPDARSALEAIAAAAVTRLPGYRLQHGNCVVELRPGGCDKGTAVRRLMAQAPFAGRMPVFAGDDFTDEDGFAAVNGLGGLSVIVGDRRPTGAHYTLRDTSALRDWLADAVHRMEAHA